MKTNSPAGAGFGETTIYFVASSLGSMTLVWSWCRRVEWSSPGPVKWSHLQTTNETITRLMQIMKLTCRLFPEFRSWLSRIPDSRIQASCLYSIGQVAFCRLIMSLTRQRSLRSFCMENRDSEWPLHNFQKWMPMHNVPTDDEIRYVLTDVPRSAMNDLLHKIHAGLDRKKNLADQKLLAMELVSLDGSGQLPSYKLRYDVHHQGSPHVQWSRTRLA
jgi:hypothetical protein